MEQLKWPVEYCESCGIFLATKEPRQWEKGFDTSQRLTWNDVCPSCGRGYQVGFRELIVPKVMTEEKPIIKLPSPDKETEEPEDITESTGEAQTFDKTKMVIERPKEPAEATAPTISQNAQDSEPAVENQNIEMGTYFCVQCNKMHDKKSTIGKEHRIYEAT